MGKLKILNILAIEDELNVTAISRKTGLNHTRVKVHLQELQEYDIVQEKRFGRIRIFKINDDEEGGYKIKKFLRSWNTLPSNSSMFP
ncbi:MAG: ArsR/SmtB family transcription factor [Candidatus Kariarchaeaceae archaeon]